MSEGKKYPIGGYAPGNYHCTCVSCGHSFIGDKRAFECEPCGIKSKAAWDSLTENEQRELLKQNALEWQKLLNQQNTTHDTK